MQSSCSYCAENGLTEGECVRGDCFDGCGDCKAVFDSAGLECRQCRKPLSPVEAVMSTVCGTCARKNHAKVVGGIS
jgi:hypothetical protein